MKEKQTSENLNHSGSKFSYVNSLDFALGYYYNEDDVDVRWMKVKMHISLNQISKYIL